MEASLNRRNVADVLTYLKDCARQHARGETPLLDCTTSGETRLRTISGWGRSLRGKSPQSPEWVHCFPVGDVGPSGKARVQISASEPVISGASPPKAVEDPAVPLGTRTPVPAVMCNEGRVTSYPML